MRKKAIIIISVIVVIIISISIYLIIKSNAIPNKTKSKLLTLVTKTLTSSKIPKINVQEAAANKDAYIFLDAREKEEYDVSHIEDALFIGASEFNLASVDGINKDDRLIVYCSVGVRSDEITKKLREAGYHDAQNLFGGIFGWINEGNNVYGIGGEVADSVHVYSKFWGIFFRFL
jgi:rhodanese-related sulfurtransferase